MKIPSPYHKKFGISYQAAAVFSESVFFSLFGFLNCFRFLFGFYLFDDCGKKTPDVVECN
jgi:hypothetical protein